MFIGDMADALHEAFPKEPVPLRRLPTLVLYFIALFDSRISLSWARLHANRVLHFSNEKASKELGISFISARQSIQDCGRALLEGGYVQCASLAALGVCLRLTCPRKKREEKQRLRKVWRGRVALASAVAVAVLAVVWWNRKSLF